MNRFVCTLILLTLAAAPARAAEDDEVRKAELSRFDVMTKGNVGALEKLLADDLTYTHSNGRFETKQEFVEAIRSGKTRYQSVEPAEIKVRVFGTTAIINGRAKIALLSSGEQKNFDVRFTDVWVKRAGRWQMVAWQSTRLP